MAFWRWFSFSQGGICFHSPEGITPCSPSIFQASASVPTFTPLIPPKASGVTTESVVETHHLRDLRLASRLDAPTSGWLVEPLKLTKTDGFVCCHCLFWWVLMVFFFGDEITLFHEGLEETLWRYGESRLSNLYHYIKWFENGSWVQWFVEAKGTADRVFCSHSDLRCFVLSLKSVNQEMKENGRDGLSRYKGLKFRRRKGVQL